MEQSEPIARLYLEVSKLTKRLKVFIRCLMLGHKLLDDWTQYDSDDLHILKYRYCHRRQCWYLQERVFPKKDWDE